VRRGVRQRLGGVVPGCEDHPPQELPQGQAERRTPALTMIDQHDAEGFGGCAQIGESTAFPKLFNST
jgi:hypothetical protein